jgi:hypothetical protein
MDQETKDLLHRTFQLAQENNRMLKAQRRAAWIGFIFKILIWIVLPAYIFVTYIAPALQQAQGALNQVTQFTGQPGVNLNLPNTNFPAILEQLKQLGR